MSKTAILILGAFLSLVSFGWIASATPKKEFLVEFIQGHFLVWSDQTMEWLDVRKGMILREEALVQSPNGGFMRLDHIKNKQSLGKFKLSAEGAIISRLSTDIVRKVKVSTIYAENFKTDGENKRLFNGFMRAWTRSTTLAKAPLDAPTASLKANSSKEGSQGSLQTLDYSKMLLYPKGGSVLITDRLPLTVPILWSSEFLTIKSVKVYLSLDSENFETNMIDRKSYKNLMVPIYEEGSYNILIDLLDGRGPVKVGSFYVVFAQSLSQGKDQK